MFKGENESRWHLRFVEARENCERDTWEFSRLLKDLSPSGYLVVHGWVEDYRLAS